MSTVMLLVIILLSIGALPAWPYSRSRGHLPSSLLGSLLLVLLILWLVGALR